MVLKQEETIIKTSELITQLYEEVSIKNRKSLKMFEVVAVQQIISELPENVKRILTVEDIIQAVQVITRLYRRRREFGTVFKEMNYSEFVNSSYDAVLTTYINNKLSIN